jgi:hypothetical protein
MQVKMMEKEIEMIKEQIGKSEDAIQMLKKTKLKDVAQLRNQQNMMKESLEVSKKRMLENAELMAVNTLFKKLKVNFDDIKVMIGELNEL